MQILLDKGKPRDVLSCSLIKFFSGIYTCGEISDREEVIKRAIAMKGENDFLLIAGKGHEDYQIIGKTKYPFDDAQVVRDSVHGSSD